MRRTPNIVLETISPERALELIDSQATPRPVRQEWISTIALDMKEGRWVPTASMIQTDRAGRLIDGQHRCYAIIEYGESVEILVQKDCDPETVHVIDTGKARTTTDQFSMRGIRYATETAAIAAFIHRRETLGPIEVMQQTPRIRTHELDKFIEDHPRIADVVLDAKMVTRKSDKTLPISISGYLIYQTEKALPPLDAAVSMRDMQPGTAEFAIARYLRISSNEKGHDRGTRDRKLSVLSKLINASIRGEPVSRVLPSDTIEDLVGGCFDQKGKPKARTLVAASNGSPAAKKAAIDAHRVAVNTKALSTAKSKAEAMRKKLKGGVA